MANGDDYLQEGFDPRNVTIPRLRSILVTHNVDYPSNAKKPQLVQLVNDYVLPQAPKLRAQRALAKRSSYGIVNAGSAEDTNTWDDRELLSPRTPSARAKSPRKSSAKVKLEEEDDGQDYRQLRSPRKRSSRSASRQLASPMDDAPVLEPPRSVRRSRRTITPQAELASEIADEEMHDSASSSVEDTVFTDDNPFQSGTSPPMPQRYALNRPLESKRLSSASKSQPSSRASGASSQFHFHESSSSPPVSKPPPPNDFLNAGEEFTPDEQLELEQAASRGDIFVAPRRTSSKQASRSSPKSALFVLLLALLSVYGAWYRQEKIAVGYCGLGRPAKRLLPLEVPLPTTLVPLVEPQCEQCPQHAYCYEDFLVRCESDFILKPHVLSLAGLVPVPPSCEPDGEKVRRVQAVAEKTIEELRERRAKFECGDLLNEQGQQEISPAIDENELKEAIGKKRNKKFSQKEFDELWGPALDEVIAKEEVVVEVEAEDTDASDPPSPASRKLSSSFARLPFTCAIKRSVWLGLARNRGSFGFVISIVLSVFYLRARYCRHVVTSAQVPALVDSVLAQLANQKELGEEDLDDPWLFLPNLRDDTLRSIHSVSERERVWQKVRAVVEQNSNVRTSQREGRSGEVGRAWEWIGPLKGDGIRRRRSGRASWITETATAQTEPTETRETKKWPEPRPYY